MGRPPIAPTAPLDTLDDHMVPADPLMATPDPHMGDHTTSMAMDDHDDSSGVPETVPSSGPSGDTSSAPPDSYGSAIRSQLAEGSVGAAGFGVLLAAESANRWEVQPGDVEICTDLLGREVVLGKGSFGQVYKARYLGASYCAVKELRSTGCADVSASILKKIAILRSARSPHIVQFLGACQLPDRTLLVTELMEGGTLWQALQRGRVDW